MVAIAAISMILFCLYLAWLVIGTVAAACAENFGFLNCEKGMTEYMFAMNFSKARLVGKILLCLAVIFTIPTDILAFVLCVICCTIARLIKFVLNSNVSFKEAMTEKRNW